VTNFTTSGTLDSFGLDPTFPADGYLGDVTGVLPGTLTFDNQQNPNDYTQGITFGSTISLTLIFTVPQSPALTRRTTPTAAASSLWTSSISTAMLF
jgi:hypothetical protein